MIKWEGTWVNLWLIHVELWQKPTQYCKAIILQLKINKFLKKKKSLSQCKPMACLFIIAYQLPFPVYKSILLPFPSGTLHMLCRGCTFQIAISLLILNKPIFAKEEKKILKKESSRMYHRACGVVPRLMASASLENQLEMQILRHSPRSTASETLGVDLAICVLTALQMMLILPNLKSTGKMLNSVYSGTRLIVLISNLLPLNSVTFIKQI